MDIVRTDAPLGAVVHGVDLAKRPSDGQIAEIEHALAEHGVLCFPDQDIDDAAHVAFTSRLGPLEINVASSGMTGDSPEIMVLSNMVRDGKPIGLADAGQGWHTDMCYCQVPGHSTALYAIEVPYENGRALGDTDFANMYLAYESLPKEVRETIRGKYVVKDFAKFWNYMREHRGSSRPPLTVEQRRRKPPVIHPVVIRHPVSGRDTLFADPSYSVAIVGLPRDESEELLQLLFDHQVKQEFVYRHVWSKHDFLIWDNLASIHRATGGYGPHQHRLMHRTQVAFDVRRHAGLAYTDNNAIHI